MTDGDPITSRSQEMMKEGLLDFDVSFAALIALLVSKKIFTIEEFQEAKKQMRPGVMERNEKIVSVLKKQQEKELEEFKKDPLGIFSQMFGKKDEKKNE